MCHRDRVNAVRCGGQSILNPGVVQTDRVFRPCVIETERMQSGVVDRVNIAASCDRDKVSTTSYGRDRVNIARCDRDAQSH